MERNTRQRDVIREVFASAGRPLTPQEAAGLAQEQMPSLGLATVYRTVKALVESGWLVSINVAGTNLFELASKNHHHHFYCLLCDRTYDIAGCNGKLEHLVPPGFVLEGHDLTLTGRCRTCSEKPRSRNA